MMTCAWSSVFLAIVCGAALLATSPATGSSVEVPASEISWGETCPNAHLLYTTAQITQDGSFFQLNVHIDGRNAGLMLTPAQKQAQLECHLSVTAYVPSNHKLRASNVYLQGNVSSLPAAGVNASISISYQFSQGKAQALTVSPTSGPYYYFEGSAEIAPNPAAYTLCGQDDVSSGNHGGKKLVFEVNTYYELTALAKRHDFAFLNLHELVFTFEDVTPCANGAAV